MKPSTTEAVYWSVGLPGVAQLLNKKYLKGIVFIILEFMVNVNANLNQVIVLSFQGKIAEAITITDYQWIMFYPCIYMFAIWDAYVDAGGNRKKFPITVLAAYLGTLGVVYSNVFHMNGIYLGPIWLGIFGLILGALLGKLLHKTFMKPNYQ
ncbi:hypothetical protein ACJ2A9_01015 [Anaerobacillus sp. MEB173]|uniref:hypothetical protein n=1 Tax=Anaerobacillus sp. MEB173 TaxID=3383345 RepID=UPI003F8DB77D